MFQNITSSSWFNSLVHMLKVALFIMVSAGLEGLLNQIASLNLNPTEQMFAILAINAVLAFLNKQREQMGILVF